jgi:hypothetical protein
MPARRGAYWSAGLLNGQLTTPRDAENSEPHLKISPLVSTGIRRDTAVWLLCVGKLHASGSLTQVL